MWHLGRGNFVIALFSGRSNDPSTATTILLIFLPVQFWHHIKSLWSSFHIRSTKCTGKKIWYPCYFIVVPSSVSWYKSSTFWEFSGLALWTGFLQSSTGLSIHMCGEVASVQSSVLEVAENILVIVHVSTDIKRHGDRDYNLCCQSSYSDCIRWRLWKAYFVDTQKHGRSISHTGLGRTSGSFSTPFCWFAGTVSALC